MVRIIGTNSQTIVKVAAIDAVSEDIAKFLFWLGRREF